MTRKHPPSSELQTLGRWCSWETWEGQAKQREKQQSWREEAKTARKLNCTCFWGRRKTKKLKQKRWRPKRPSANEQINKIRFSLYNEENLTRATTWMNLEDIILSDIMARKRQILSDPLTWALIVWVTGRKEDGGCQGREYLTGREFGMMKKFQRMDGGDGCTKADDFPP